MSQPQGFYLRALRRHQTTEPRFGSSLRHVAACGAMWRTHLSDGREGQSGIRCGFALGCGGCGGWGGLRRIEGDAGQLNELLGLETEYADLDFKQLLDLTTAEGAVELAKHVGAMQVEGGYIVVGVDDQGKPVDGLADINLQTFDEANLTQKLGRYLPEPLLLDTQRFERDGNAVVLIYVGRHPAGCAIFKADGQYEKDGSTVVRFRAGEVFWRDGTRSVRISQRGFETIVERRIADAKESWREEQQAIRRDDFRELQRAFESRQLTDAPLGAVNFDLDISTLTTSALELLRKPDPIALQHLLNDSLRRARLIAAQEDFESELGDLVDKLVCLAATLLDYEQRDWFGTLTARRV